MQKVNHPVGNFKISLIKKTSSFLSTLILFFLGLILRIDKKESEIIISNAFFAPWKVNKKFFNSYKKVKNYTLLDVRRLYTLWLISDQLKNINGTIIDVGCMKGGAGFLLAMNNIRNKTYLIDTFNGYIDNEKFYKNNIFNYNNYDLVKKKIRELKLKNTIVIKGVFPNNLIKNFKKKKIKLCHLDVNTYNSSLRSFYFIKDKIIKGGYIIFDDFGMYGADGIKKLINKIKKNYSEKFHFIYNFQGQCILIKK